VFVLTVFGQQSAPFNLSAVHYQAPTIIGVSVPFAGLSTLGGDLNGITLTGTDFGE
jgi:hypothetical protein